MRKGETTYKATIRRNRIRELLEIIPPWDLDVAELARTHKVSAKMIYIDIEKILSSKEPEDRAVLLSNVQHTFKEAIRTARTLMKDSDPRVRAQGVNSTLSALNSYLSFMERMGVHLSLAPGQKMRLDELKELLKLTAEEPETTVTTVKDEEPDVSPPLEGILGQSAAEEDAVEPAGDVDDEQEAEVSVESTGVTTESDENRETFIDGKAEAAKKGMLRMGILTSIGRNRCPACGAEYGKPGSEYDGDRWPCPRCGTLGLRF